MYKEPEIYDLAYKGTPGDVQFYSKISNSGSVLYLGVGSGRIFSKIYDNNEKIFGVDYSPTMLKKLKRKIPNINSSRLIVWNVLKSPKVFRNKKFDKIIAPFSFFTQFSESDIQKILKNCHELLSEDGVLVTDFFCPYVNPSEDFKEVNLSDGDLYIKKYELYDHAEQLLLEVTHVKDRNKIMSGELLLKFYFPDQIKKIFSKGKFKSELYGNFSKGPLTKSSKTILLIAKKLR